MMRNKPREPPARPAIPDPACTIYRMKSRERQRGRIPNVVQVRSRYKQVVIIRRDSVRNPARLLGSLLNMTPAIPER